MTPVNVARNRYDEARAILDAWRTRVRRKSDILGRTGDETLAQEVRADRINLRAAEEEHRIALRAWTTAADAEIKASR